MSILYNTEATLAERVDECLADDFKHNAIKAAQEAFYVKRGEIEMVIGEGRQQLRTHEMKVPNLVPELLPTYAK